MYLAISGELAAVLCIEDPLREEAREIVAALKETGIRKVVMMTGDSAGTAAAIAKKTGVDAFYAEVLPEDKASFVEQEKAEGRKVIMAEFLHQGLLRFCTIFLPWGFLWKV